MIIIHFVIFITFLLVKVLAVPPAICREEFRWDDCGQQPQPVVYYFKKGSRCEIGLWKGCLPNPNMFANEYECINTCIYQERPVTTRTESEPEDEIKKSSDEDAETDTTTGDNGDTTDENQTEPTTNGEEGTDDKNGTATDASSQPDTAQTDAPKSDAPETVSPVTPELNSTTNTPELSSTTDTAELTSSTDTAATEAEAEG